MKILVDYDLCEANARCMEVAADIFKVDEEDNLHILNESPSEDRRQAIEEAVRLCPRQALAIQDE